MDYIFNGKSLDNYLHIHLTEKRIEHIHSVVQEAEKLAKMYDGDVEKVTLAALFHDMVREMSVEELNSYVKKYNLSEEYLDNRNVSHGKVAAELMREEWGISDEDMINAVSYHTTGRPEMSKTEKIVFIADAIEPKRNYDGVVALRKATYRSLDEGCLASLTNTIKHLEEKGVKNIDEDTIKAKKWFEDQLK